MYVCFAFKICVLIKHVKYLILISIQLITLEPYGTFMLTFLSLVIQGHLAQPEPWALSEKMNEVLMETLDKGNTNNITPGHPGTTQLSLSFPSSS